MNVQFPVQMDRQAFLAWVQTRKNVTSWIGGVSS